MRQPKVVIDLEYGELLAQASLLLAQRVDPAADRRHMLTQVQVEPFHEGRIDLPPLLGQHVLDGLTGTAYHTVAHADQTPATILLDHLGIKQLRQGPPPWLWGRALCLLTLRLHPQAEMRQDGAEVTLVPIGQKEWDTRGR